LKFIATYRSFSIVLFSIILISSCGGDTKSNNQITLAGKWKIYQTIRGKKPSNTLQGGYFIFDDDNSFKTNLPLDPNFPTVLEKEYTFEWKDDKISISDLNPPLEFVVKLPHEDSLTLGCKIQKAPMTFYMVRDSLGN